jgi:hypothetical protein
MRPLDCWNRDFESPWGHLFSGLVCVLCCVGSSTCSELILFQRSSTARAYMCVCVCVFLIVCDIETLTMRRSRPDLGCNATKKLITFWFFKVPVIKEDTDPLQLFSSCTTIACTSDARVKQQKTNFWKNLQVLSVLWSRKFREPLWWLLLRRKRKGLGANLKVAKGLFGSIWIPSAERMLLLSTTRLINPFLGFLTIGLCQVPT